MVGIFLFMRVVDDYGLLDDMEKQETNGQREHRLDNREVEGPKPIVYFRKDIEENYANQYAGGKTHYQMQPVFDFDAKKTSEGG